MSWKLHIDKTVKKGNSTLGFLRRNLRINSEDVKSDAYISLVRPNLEYCSIIWNPYHKDQVYKLEMVQWRAARYATNQCPNTSSVSEMLDHLNWETLESRGTKAQLTMMFRIVNSLVDVPLEQYRSNTCIKPNKISPLPQIPADFIHHILLQEQLFPLHYHYMEFYETSYC